MQNPAKQYDAPTANLRLLMGMDRPPAIIVVLAAPKKKQPTKKQQWRKYKALVWKLTNAKDLSTVPNIHLREWRKYDLDHIISIWDGFNRGLPAAAIASISNVRIISHQENADKGTKSHYHANPLAWLLVPMAA